MICYVSDRGANRVYRLGTNGVLTAIAGNGSTSGGGDGFPALQTGLIAPRCVAFLPNGGWFTSEHSPGNRIWYVDPAGIIHRWVNGNDANNFRVGDGQWFYDNSATPKVSRVRSVIPDRLWPSDHCGKQLRIRSAHQVPAPEPVKASMRSGAGRSRGRGSDWPTATNAPRSACTSADSARASSANCSHLSRSA